MILRLCIVIPAFNDSATINSVVKEALAHSRAPVLIVDDGSQTPVENCLYSWDVRQALEQDRVRVMRLEHSRGRTAALRLAIEDLVGRGFTHMLTIDADDLSLAREINGLCEVALENPGDLILGFRGDQPKRTLASFWVGDQTGITVRDPQNVFRIYPLLQIQDLKLFSERRGFESEILVRAIWSGISVREVEVQGETPPSHEHIRPLQRLREGLRVLALNAALTGITMFKRPKSIWELATALALGVFASAAPLIGWKIALVTVTAFVLRLDLVAMAIACVLSVPTWWSDSNWLLTGAVYAVGVFALILGLGYLTRRRIEALGEVVYRHQRPDWPRWNRAGQSDVSLCPQGAKVDAAEVELIPAFGRLTAVHVAPMRSAVQQQTPIGLAFDSIVTAKRVYSYAPSEARDVQIYNWVRDCVRELERELERHPADWPRVSAHPRPVGGPNFWWEDLQAQALSSTSAKPFAEPMPPAGP